MRTASLWNTKIAPSFSGFISTFSSVRFFDTMLLTLASFTVSGRPIMPIDFPAIGRGSGSDERCACATAPRISFPVCKSFGLRKRSARLLTGEVTDQDASYAVDPIAELLVSLI